MSIVQALILGIFQGISEFLPISSSGHLLVFKDLMGLSEVPGLFDVILHVATLFSVLVVFRKRIAGIILSSLRFVRRRSGEADAENLAIVPPAIAATVCTAVVGLLIDRIDFSGQVRLVSGFFIVTAVILQEGWDRLPAVDHKAGSSGGHSPGNWRVSGNQPLRYNHQRWLGLWPEA